MPARVTLIHATPVAIDPVREAFSEIWPDAEVANILDDSLSTDRAAAGLLTDDLTDRIGFLARYAAGSGAAGILFTCSAFGSAIEAAAEALPIPVFKPNEAMFRSAISKGDRIAMIATFQPSVEGMEAEFADEARRMGSSARIESFVVPEAMAALRSGDRTTHDRMVAECAGRLTGYDAIMLAHFSTARAFASASASTSIPVLTSPGAAVRMLKEAVGETVTES